MNQIIECENLTRTFSTKSFGKKTRQHVALHDLNIQIESGEVFGLLGPNGAGKTTTIKILSTLLIPTSGKAQILGMDVVREAVKVRKNIGLILGGDRGFYGRLTGKENLRYFAVMNDIDRSLIPSRVSEVLGSVGLTFAGDTPVDQYSRGMKQRLHIARGIITDPKVLFMDEPTIGLDPAGAEAIRELIPMLISEGKTILLTTHYMFEADELCDRIAIINKGELLVIGTPKEIKDNFSKVSIFEIVVHYGRSDYIEQLHLLNGVIKVTSGSDGPLTKITLYSQPGIDHTPTINEILGLTNIVSCIERNPNLEEAYLSIIS